MSKKRIFRDRYREIIRALANKHGEEGSGYHISKHATLSRCIKYTMDYIVKGDRVHYRYNKYNGALLHHLNRNPVNTGTIIHVDIGCGPGLFTWVVLDHFRPRSSINVESYGYDYAPKMVKLARLIWKRFGEDERYSCHHNIEKLMTLLRNTKEMCPYILVTFGHVLIQTRGDYKAQADFALIIANLARLAKCRIIAVDATTRDRPANFRESCDGLKVAMEKRGLAVDNPHIVESEMWTVARMRHQA